MFPLVIRLLSNPHTAPEAVMHREAWLHAMSVILLGIQSRLHCAHIFEDPNSPAFASLSHSEHKLTLDIWEAVNSIRPFIDRVSDDRPRTFCYHCADSGDILSPPETITNIINSVGNDLTAFRSSLMNQEIHLITQQVEAWKQQWLADLTVQLDAEFALLTEQHRQAHQQSLR